MQIIIIHICIPTLDVYKVCMGREAEAEGIKLVHAALGIKRLAQAQRFLIITPHLLPMQEFGLIFFILPAV